MSTIRITRRHDLGDEQVRDQIEELAREFASQIGLAYQWQGNQVNLERSGASGYIRLHPGELEVELKLGMLLRPFSGKIEDTINRYLDEHLKT